MKSFIRYTLALLPLATVTTACNDGYLEKFPETSITEKVFFQSVADLETYSNSFYSYFDATYWDDACDNVVYKEESSVYSLMRGERNPSNAGSWSSSWSWVRTVNFMLNRCDNATGDESEKAHYIGLARCMRGLIYYDLVKRYSDVPWYDRDLQTTDTEELYKPQDSRAFVVDKIFEDLEFAAENMLEGSSRTRLQRHTALAILARIALHEGTFRKYHPELKLADADRFLQKAADAAEELMGMGFSLSTVSIDGLEPYESLFVSSDLTGNPEMIMVEAYDKTLGRYNNAQKIYAYHGLSRSLVEDYLVVDGENTRTFQSLPGHETMTRNEVLENRDPRLRQTVMWPGFQRADQSSPTRPDVTVGGYAQIKSLPRQAGQFGWGNSYNDLILYRYGETLLIYAEAKAELGTLTQDDLDKSVNLLRRRVGMPSANLSKWLSEIDPVQDTRYPNVSSTQKGAVLEVRRERRVELACEGLRYNDLMRWGCGKAMEATPEGMYVPGPGMYDYTGDGEPDIAFVMPGNEDIISEDDRVKYKLNIYTLNSSSAFALTEGDHGYIYLVSQKDKFNFVEPKYYYSPVSQSDINLNPNLVQNPYWAD